MQNSGHLDLSDTPYGQQAYSFDLELNFDWLDLRVLDEINHILALEGADKHFYAAVCDYQCLIVFYCDGDWARQFERKTGCDLFDAA